MIRYLRLKNFKCFEDLQLEMSYLNVYAGINSMGKSTAIQALLLLRQAYEMGSLKKGIYLNGDLTRLGTGYDLLYRNSQSDEITISLDMDEIKFCNVYKYAKESDFQKIMTTDIKTEVAPNVNLFGGNFSYISSERQGPQRFYGGSHWEIFEKNQVGVKGEFWASYLAEKGLQEKVSNRKVLHAEASSDFLIYQMQAWLSELSPGIHLNPKKFPEAGIVSMEYTVSTESYSPMNVGFGLSYVAPIVLSLLKARSGDLVMVENPEAHLHPRGQRKMGELVARAASGGVQVIVETHSDHLLNGVRLAVKRKEICREDIRLNYFYRTIDKDAKLGGQKHVKCSPMILEDGGLSAWPDGFFDEWDKALEELF